MTATNNRRLGANEAPPAILSVFLGRNLTNMLDKLEKEVSNSKMTPEEKTALKLGIGRIPEILLDNTDRNHDHDGPQQQQKRTGFKYAQQ